MDVSKLLSPPTGNELDRFGPAHPSTTSEASRHIRPSASTVVKHMLPPAVPATGTAVEPSPKEPPSIARLLSPPVTPAKPLLHRMDLSPLEEGSSPSPVVADESGSDPLLFTPRAPASTVAVDRPLFPSSTPSPPPDEWATVRRPSAGGPRPTDVDPSPLDALVNRHMNMHMAQFRHSKHKPTKEEYMLAVTCVSMVTELYAANPRRWLQQERRFLDERFGGANRVGKRTAPPPAFARIAPAPAASTSKNKVVVVPPVAAASSSSSSSSGASRSSMRPPRPPRSSPLTPTPRRIVVATDAASTVIVGAGDDDDDGRRRRRRQRRRQRAAQTTDGSIPTARRVIGTSREDTNYRTLPDYAPSTSTLPVNSPKSLKADWRGQALDLSTDPDRHQLHPAELHLASTLRLSCATYLCSKRRIFAARLEALRVGKEFRKTDSQQACKIDVNKASKLWSAFDRVGWFRPDHFRSYL